MWPLYYKTSWFLLIGQNSIVSQLIYGPCMKLYLKKALYNKYHRKTIRFKDLAIGLYVGTIFVEIENSPHVIMIL